VAIAHDAGEVACVLQSKDQAFRIQGGLIPMCPGVKLLCRKDVISWPRFNLANAVEAIVFVKDVIAHVLAVPPVHLASPDIQDGHVFRHLSDGNMGVIAQANVARRAKVHAEKWRVTH
jgi:hypothetical protein